VLFRSSAYKRATFNSKYFEDINKIERIKSNLSKGIPKKDIANLLKIDETIIDEVKEINDDDDFWIKYEDKKGNVTIKIDSLKYKYWLERKGFKKYYPDIRINKIKNKLDALIVAVSHKEFLKLNYNQLKKILKNKNSIIIDVKSIFNDKKIMNNFDYWSL
jgi:hypothetical protein